MEELNFDSVMRQHGQMLGRISQTYEARSAQREELLQDIALAIWKALPTWRGESSLKTFIARVAHNRGVDHVMSQRKHGVQVELSDQLVDPHSGPEAVALRQDQSQLLLSAIRRLSLSQQQVLTLALEGFPHAEIAATLGITVINVDVRLARARQALKEMLGEKR